MKDSEKRIEACRVNRKTELNLSSCGLNSIPDSVFELTHLEILSIQNNSISEIPSEIHKLKNVYYLNLAKNNLKEFPSNLLGLRSLNTLDVSHNAISEIPPSITDLSVLEDLNFAYNKIDDIAEEVFTLMFLRKLNLEGNGIYKIPIKIGECHLLRKLTIHHNKIKYLPKEIEYLINLEYINLDENKILNVPIEIISRGAKSIVNYFQSLKEQIKLYEAKILIVGEGNVGKTSLLNRIMYSSIDSNEATTEGIDIRKCLIEVNELGKFRVNFWDFGGQEIYHSTHQFFLTRRSLYLFVWTARADEAKFDYWLNIVKLLSQDSPVILVMNKADERIKMIDEVSVVSSFSNVKSFQRISAKLGSGIDNLMEVIRSELKALPHVGHDISKTWIDIRTSLESLDTEYIDYSDYLELCASFGLNEEQANFISQYYHDLGVFLHFQESFILKNILILKPEWATNAVYKIADTRAVQSRFGKFTFDQLSIIWKGYPRNRFIHLIELMKKFEICFQLPNSQTFIIPDMLEPSRPDIVLSKNGKMALEYHYKFMPSGIITRFIVRIHDLIIEDRYWKNGVFIEREGITSLVECYPFERKIKIWIQHSDGQAIHGSSSSLEYSYRIIIEIIRREMEIIHKSLNNPEVSEMVPCPCKECEENEDKYLHEYDVLLKAKAKSRNKVECKKSFEDIQIGDILGYISSERHKDVVRENTTNENHELQKVINYIKLGELKQSLEILENHCINKSLRGERDTIISLIAKLDRISKDYGRGMVDVDKYDEHVNKITFSTIQMVNQLSD